MGLVGLRNLICIFINQKLNSNSSLCLVAPMLTAQVYRGETGLGIRHSGFPFSLFCRISAMDFSVPVPLADLMWSDMMIELNSF